MIEANSANTPAWPGSARASDPDAFRRLVDPFHRELLVHCYRLLGSLEDAEDILQETLLRAWRGLASFEGRATLRAWLYKIATNVALDALRSKRPRSTPTQVAAPADPYDPLPEASAEPIWLEPLPDLLVDDRLTSNPEAKYEAREATTLAFLAALQSLPGRQRAVLILRDVLAWKATEVATLLDTTVQSVNSALQRARSTMKQKWHTSAPASTTITSDSQISSLLARYVDAWEAADVAALVSLLREDAVLTMPPFQAWYRGRDTIGIFVATKIFTGGVSRPFRLVSTRANNAPAFAVYQPDSTGVYRASALQVLTIVNGEVAQIDDFLAFDQDNKIFARFGLPTVI